MSLGGDRRLFAGKFDRIKLYFTQVHRLSVGDVSFEIVFDVGVGDRVGGGEFDAEVELGFILLAQLAGKLSIGGFGILVFDEVVFCFQISQLVTWRIGVLFFYLVFRTV